jgi:hypothetical protein
MFVGHFSTVLREFVKMDLITLHCFYDWRIEFAGTGSDATIFSHAMSM